MNKRDEVKKIWRESFKDSTQYVDMYFNRVYRDEDAMLLVKDGHTVSSLLLQPYSFRFHNDILPIGYIAGAATRRSCRGRGYMSELMRHTLQEAVSRGYMMCALIPAHDWLYFYYDKFGFSTVFYVDAQRFTSGHTFPVRGHYDLVDNPHASEVYEAFHRLELERSCSVVHSSDDFLNILDDLRIDNGHFVAVSDASGNIVSMAWAAEADDVVIVKEVLAADDDACVAALRQLRGYYPNKPFKLLALPLSDHRKLYARGMARIVNVKFCLDVIASSCPDYTSVIRVYDRLLPHNSHTYIVSNGECFIDDTPHSHIDLDVSLEVFNEIVFSSRKIGDIIKFPSVRPHMSLMLD